jgi:UDP-N-acetylmuramyl tripeptide synthase
VQLPGLYNVYNVLGASAAARSLGVPAETIRATLRDFVAPFGRIERVDLRGRRLTLALIKNPTGANEVLRLFRSAPPAPLLICINDLIADGRDVSWLWDTDFEALADYPAPIIVSGIRALDMAVRLKYARVPADQITVVPNIGDALIAVAEQAEPGADAYVLPTYTAMLAAREALHDQGALRDVWATAERR